MALTVDLNAERFTRDLVGYGRSFKDSYDRLYDLLGKAALVRPHQMTSRKAAHIAALSRDIADEMEAALQTMNYFLSVGPLKNVSRDLKARLEKLGDAPGLLTHDVSIRELMAEITRDASYQLEHLRAIAENRPQTTVVSRATLMKKLTGVKTSAPANDNPTPPGRVGTV